MKLDFWYSKPYRQEWFKQVRRIIFKI
jgi:hypothetical protein